MSETKIVIPELVIPKDAYEQVDDLREAIDVGETQIFCVSSLYVYRPNYPNHNWDTFELIGEREYTLSQRGVVRVLRAFHQKSLVALDSKVEEMILQKGEALPRKQMYGV